MPDPKLEEVFKLSGIPSFTFVAPIEYPRLVVALRTAGRGLVLEGPSGIGKTTAITRALQELGLEEAVTRLSARKAEDREYIEALPALGRVGTVIVDDFHRLEPHVRERVADYMKTLADEERADVKLVVVGINRAGDTLISFARDLANRIEIIRFEANPSGHVSQLLSQGAEALNIDLEIADDITEAANGSFYIAQLLGHEVCLENDVTEAQAERTTVRSSIELVRSRVVGHMDSSFLPIATKFAAGPRLRQDGRAPYLHMLKWLAEANEWSVQLDREMARHPDLRGSVGQVVTKDFLRKHIESNPDIGAVIHFEPQTSVLAVEDPQFVYYIRNLNWNWFARHIGYTSISFESRYDFALSFAGTDRDTAERLSALLAEEEFEVFYDRNEQHRMLAENLEEYLGPIYRSEAAFVVVLLGPDYPKRIWTKFESDQFKERFGAGRVIPIWFSTSPPGLFDETTRVAGITFDPAGDQETQLVAIAAALRAKKRTTDLEAITSAPPSGGLWSLVDGSSRDSATS